MYGIYAQSHERDVCLNEGYDRVILGPQEVWAFLQDPELRSIYESAPCPVMKADIIRIAALYERGGWYIDMDVLLRCSLEEIRARSPQIPVILFAEEDNKTRWPCPRENRNMKLRIAYDVFFVSKPRDSYLQHAINVLKSRCNQKQFASARNFCGIMFYTGPDMWTTAYHTYPDQGRCRVHSTRVGAELLDFVKAGSWRRGGS